MRRLLRITCLGLGLASAGAGFYPLGVGIYLFAITSNVMPDDELGIGGTEHLFFVKETQISRGMLLAGLVCIAIALFALGSGLIFVSRRLQR